MLPMFRSLHSCGKSPSIVSYLFYSFELVQCLSRRRHLGLGLFLGLAGD